MSWWVSSLHSGLFNWSNDLWVGLKKISNPVQCNRRRKGSWLCPRWWIKSSLGFSRQSAASLLKESHFQDEPIPYSSHISDNPFDAHTENPEKASEALFVIPHGKENWSTCTQNHHLLNTKPRIGYPDWGFCGLHQTFQTNTTIEGLPQTQRPSPPTYFRNH